MNDSHTCAVPQGRRPVHIVVACNQGDRRSVAVVELLKVILTQDGFTVNAQHLHLHGFDWKPSTKCFCDACNGERDLLWNKELINAWNEAKDRMRQIFHAVAD